MTAPDFIAVTQADGYRRIVPTKSILLVKVHVDGAGACVQVWLPSPHIGTPPTKLTVLETIEEMTRLLDASHIGKSKPPAAMAPK